MLPKKTPADTSSLLPNAEKELFQVDSTLPGGVQPTSPCAQSEPSPLLPIPSQVIPINPDEAPLPINNTPLIDNRSDLDRKHLSVDDEWYGLDSTHSWLDKDNEIYKWTELSPEQKIYREVSLQNVERRFKEAGVDIEENFQDYAQFEADNGPSRVIECWYIIMNYNPRFFSSPLWYYILELISHFLF